MHPKVSVSIFGSAVVGIILWIVEVLTTTANEAGLDVPGPIAIAMSTVVVAVLGFLTPSDWWAPSLPGGIKPRPPIAPGQ